MQDSRGSSRSIDSGCKPPNSPCPSPGSPDSRRPCRAAPLPARREQSSHSPHPGLALLGPRPPAPGPLTASRCQGHRRPHGRGQGQREPGQHAQGPAALRRGRRLLSAAPGHRPGAGGQGASPAPARSPCSGLGSGPPPSSRPVGGRFPHTSHCGAEARLPTPEPAAPRLPRQSPLAGLSLSHNPIYDSTCGYLATIMVSSIKDYYDFRCENNWNKGLKSATKGRDIVNLELEQSSFQNDIFSTHFPLK